MHGSGKTALHKGFEQKLIWRCGVWKEMTMVYMQCNDFGRCVTMLLYKHCGQTSLHTCLTPIQHLTQLDKSQYIRPIGFIFFATANFNFCP